MTPQTPSDASTKPRRRYAPRMAPEQRREQLIAAALSVIVEQGYEGVSIETIARTAGVTRPVIYDHFPNLGRLLQALIEREDVAVTVTHTGYIKRTPLAEYRVQGRGGKGRTGMATREEDFVTHIFAASTHAPLLFFSSTGMAYKLKVWRLPEARIQGRGKAMVNLLPLAEGERITTVLPLPEDEAQWEKLNVVFATRLGDVRRNELSDFVNVKANGKIAMKLEPGDGIVGVQTCTDADDVLLTTKAGKCIRFALTDVRIFKGRQSTGVRGIKLASGDEIVSGARRG